MKQALLLFAFALMCACSFGQALHKGSLLGFHVYTIQLKENVSMDDYVKFLNSKLKPEIERSFPGMKPYLIKGMRGQDSSRIGMIYMFNNEADRNKYFKDDGSATDAANAAYAKLNATFAEMGKYGTFDDDRNQYTDWRFE